MKAEYPLIMTPLSCHAGEFPKVSLHLALNVFMQLSPHEADVAVADAFKARLKETFPGRPEEPASDV